MFNFLIIKYLLIVKFREYKNIIKNLFMGILILFIFVATFFGQLGQFLILNNTFMESYKNIFFHCLGIVAVVIIILKKDPFLKIHPATMIYFYGYKILDFKLFILLIKSFIAFLSSIMIALLLHQFKLSIPSFLSLFQSWNLIMLVIIYRYFNETEVGKQKAVSLVMTGLFILWNVQFYLPIEIKVGTIICLSGLILVGIKKVMICPFNYGEVFDKNLKFYRIKYLTIHNKIEGSQSYIRENSIKESEVWRLLGFVRNPLLKKNIVAFYRSNFTITIYILLIYVGIASAYRFNFFDLRDHLERINLVHPILAVHQSLLITNIINVILDQYMVLVSKSKEGLYLPYTKKEIIRSFFTIGVVVVLIITVLFNFIIKSSIIISILEFIAYTIFLYFVLLLKKIKRFDYINRLIYFLIFVSTLLIMNIS